MSLEFDRSWMWHPDFTEDRTDTAGLFVHFRKDLTISIAIPASLVIRITADTRYKLYVNSQRVAFGPVKGDQSLWFYDDIDIVPFIHPGRNRIAVHVLRLFHATTFAPSFVRTPFGGVRITVPGEDGYWKSQLESNTMWETAIDPSTTLRIDEPEDHFLHIYEKTSRPRSETSSLDWKPAMLREFKNSTGNILPWSLSPRLLPFHKITKTQCSTVHNVESCLAPLQWEMALTDRGNAETGLLLPAGTKHKVDVEMSTHITAFLRIHFKRPKMNDGVLRVVYSECYEDKPESTPWVRKKEGRRDSSKALYGPQDIYQFQGADATEEVFMPFHFRTFRFLNIQIDTGSEDLVLLGLDIETVNYPLETLASFKVEPWTFSEVHLWQQLWSTSLRTLSNCMHDCYEDCPFYEQLQYAMDARSSSLFTYSISGDDRLARQAIMQLHNTFQPQIGLTASRAPTHRLQFIPHFSLYWICMIGDHLTYFGDIQFVSRFLPVIDAVLSYFHSRIDVHGLVTAEVRPGIWNFVDWTSQWKPHGVPPAIERTGISTFTNQLYAYTLFIAAQVLAATGRTSIAEEYRRRGQEVNEAVKVHCYDGEFFADTLATEAKPVDYSLHCQVWAVLSGAVTGPEAQDTLRKGLQKKKTGQFVEESVSMSFYTLRAMSLAGAELYDENFHQFWSPWQDQLSQNVTTWVEDNVSKRSDCHAWGSVPLYEFTAEVAGIRPGESGWAVVQFRPRLGLFRELEATVPLKMTGGTSTGVVHVSWSVVDGETKIHLQADLTGLDSIPVDIVLPGQKTRILLGTNGFQWVIPLESVKRYGA
ncbi:Six-hairpin glycosidase [Aspergillus steynii IBT 23096]|uniref:Six-hairpin glycosidase n=1 Tax=Aspergillus steynii IBT 23096 TaxID=1392250 RepID=A0A2I2FWX1_9EURO|nr:Six-hairpin glycosidase [Aspergillus steynii IBT 23096]PLB45133.1 Six-hairpin glycosidase [Aspergillus steynii IBT 23096]